MSLDLSSLKKAVDSLDRAMKVASGEIHGQVNTAHEEVIRAGVIQNFEFTYELCWKFMKRRLELNAGAGSADGSTRKELFRLAAESRLITGIENWFKYHSARNETAHTYAPARLDAAVIGALKEAFEESDLPFRADILDWNAISEEFQKVILSKYEVLTPADKL